MMPDREVAEHLRSFMRDDSGAGHNTDPDIGQELRRDQYLVHKVMDAVTDEAQAAGG